MREGCERWLPKQPARSAEAKRSLKQPDTERSIGGTHTKMNSMGLAQNKLQVKPKAIFHLKLMD
jgi:hypothetical protein